MSPLALKSLTTSMHAVYFRSRNNQTLCSLAFFLVRNYHISSSSLDAFSFAPELLSWWCSNDGNVQHRAGFLSSACNHGIVFDTLQFVGLLYRCPFFRSSLQMEHKNQCSPFSCASKHRINFRAIFFGFDNYSLTHFLSRINGRQPDSTHEANSFSIRTFSSVSQQLNRVQIEEELLLCTRCEFSRPFAARSS